MSGANKKSGPPSRQTDTRSVTIPAPWVRKNGCRDDPIVGVAHEVAVFLDFSGNGVFLKNPRSWSQARVNSYNPDPPFWILQLMLLLSETSTKGSMRIKPTITMASNPDQYKKTVDLAARQLVFSNLTTEEKSVLKSRMVTDQYMDAWWTYYVRVAAIKLKHTEKEKGGGGGGRGRAASGPAHKWQQLYGAFSFYQLVDGRHAQTRALDKYDRACAELSSYNDELRRLMRAQDEEANPDLQAEIDGMPQPQCAPGELTPKIRFVVVPIPHDGSVIAPTRAQMEENPDLLCGILCRFLLMDADLNPGAFFDELIDNLAKRRKQALSQNRRGGMSGFSEMFPHYTNLFETIHPAGNRTRDETYYKVLSKLRPDLFADPRGDAFMYAEFKAQMCNPQHSMHLFRVASIDTAMREMQKAGAHPNFSVANLWWDAQRKAALFPRAWPSYRYHEMQTAWVHPENVALIEQFFPHISADTDILTALSSGGSVDHFLDPSIPAAPVVGSPIQMLQEKIANEWIIPRREVLGSTMLDYVTDNEFVHRHAQTVQVRARLAQEQPQHHEETLRQIQELVKTYPDSWQEEVESGRAENWLSRKDDVFMHPKVREQRVMARSGLSLMERVAQCDRYNRLYQLMQKTAIRQFEVMWPVEGDMSALPIPDTIRVMLAWWSERRLPHITREFFIWDKDIGITGNMLLLCNTIFSKIRKALHPNICLMVFGLWSTYHHTPAKIGFNLVLTGGKGKGKTFSGPKMAELISIKGTTRSYSSSSAQADQSGCHRYDVIVIQDEVESVVTRSEKHAKDPERVNMEKTKLSERRTERNVLEYHDTPDGQHVRQDVIYVTDHYETRVGTTNDPQPPEEALASRMNFATIDRSSKTPQQMEGHVGAALESDTTTFFRIGQYLTACTFKSIMYGVMAEPEMKLFDEISARVIEYLTAEGVVNDEIAARNLDTIRPYAVQMTSMKAQHCAFDLPTSPHYKQPFRAASIAAVAPYLYCTTEIAWWTWTILASRWINENNSRVLLGIAKAIGVPDDDVEGVNMYRVYECDRHNLPWRVCPVGKTMRQQRARDGSDDMIDINYLTLDVGVTTDGWDAVSKRIALCVPQLSPVDVMGALRTLSGTFITKQEGWFLAQPRGDLKDWHRFVTLPDDEGLGGTKQTAGTMPTAFMTQEESQEIAQGTFNNVWAPRTAKHLPRLDPQIPLPLVDISEIDQGRIHVMLNVANYCRQQRIVEGLLRATVIGSTQPQKFLLGIPNEEDSTHMTTFHLKEDQKDAWIEATDEYIHDNPDLISRQHGLVTIRYAALSDVDNRMLTSAAIVPVADPDARVERYISEAVRMSVPLEISTDLDYESASRRHIQCGLPLNEPVQTPNYILDQLKRHYSDMGDPDGWHKKLNYPADFLRSSKERDNKAKAMNTCARDGRNVRRIFYPQENVEDRGDTVVPNVSRSRIHNGGGGGNGEPPHKKGKKRAPKNGSK